MNNDSCIDEVVELYFNGYILEEAIKVTKNELKEKELKRIVEEWDAKLNGEPVKESRGWKYQQPRII